MSEGFIFGHTVKLHRNRYVMKSTGAMNADHYRFFSIPWDWEFTESSKHKLSYKPILLKINTEDKIKLNI